MPSGAVTVPCQRVRPADKLRRVGSDHAPSGLPYSAGDLAAFVRAVQRWRSAGYPHYIDCHVGRDYLRWVPNQGDGILEAFEAMSTIDAARDVLLLPTPGSIGPITVPEGDGVLVADIDPADADRRRVQIPVLAVRRPEVYARPVLRNVVGDASRPMGTPA